MHLINSIEKNQNMELISQCELQIKVVTHCQIVCIVAAEQIAP